MSPLSTPKTQRLPVFAHKQADLARHHKICSPLPPPAPVLADPEVADFSPCLPCTRSTCRLYIAVDGVIGFLSSNGLAPYPKQKVKGTLATIEQAKGFLAEGK